MDPLWWVGLAVVLYFGFAAVRGAWSFMRTRRTAPQHLRARYARAGTWAVVTGGSEGIGKAFALELAAVGFDVCIIARTASKLDSAVAQIKAAQRPGGQTKAITFDFASQSSAAYATLFAELDKLPLAILVNNVGMTHKWTGEMFDDVSVDADINLFNINCVSTVRMSKYAVPRLKKNGSGAIINISSLTSIMRAVPYFSQYAASKSFVRSFSESLTFELEPFGIDVLTVTPSFVSTALTQGVASAPPPVDFFVVDAAGVARNSLWALGTSVTTAGHQNHQLMQWIFDALPREWLGRNINKLVTKDAEKFKEQRQIENSKKNL